MSDAQKPGGIRLRLPATSANLGPGFDAVAVALDVYLELEGDPAEKFSITATGRDAERCARIDDNLILEAYKKILRDQARPIVPLAIRMVNGIPLGMGCGSSAAGRLAAIALANHFGKFGWQDDRILEEAYALEGHPDNVAACWLGGFVTAASEGKRVHTARIDPPEAWRAIIALPAEPLSTTQARAMLPAKYPLADVVANLQSVAMLALAFEQGRGDLLQLAMKDRIHQPYRESSCPLLPPLRSLVGSHGILGVALSGAGPAVLVVVGRESEVKSASEVISHETSGRTRSDLMPCRFARTGASQLIEIT
jgi:homoserine kinase